MLKFLKKEKTDGNKDNNKKSKFTLNLSKKEKILISLIFVFILGSAAILSYIFFFKETKDKKREYNLRRHQLIALRKERYGKYNVKDIGIPQVKHNERININTKDKTSQIKGKPDIKNIKDKGINLNKNKENLQIENTNTNFCKLSKPIKNYENVFKDFFIKKYLKEKAKEKTKKKVNVRKTKTNKVRALYKKAGSKKRKVKSKKVANKKDLKIKAIYCIDVCYAITEDDTVIKDGQKIDGKVAKVSPSGVQFK